MKRCVSCSERTKKYPRGGPQHRSAPRSTTPFFALHNPGTERAAANGAGVKEWVPCSVPRLCRAKNKAADHGADLYCGSRVKIFLVLFEHETPCFTRPPEANGAFHAWAD